MAKAAGHCHESRRARSEIFAVVMRALQAEHRRKRCGQPGSLFLEGFLALAQLRDVFTAENSAVVPQKNEHRWTARPQGPENYFPSIAIRKSDQSQLGAKRLFHDASILGTASHAVKPRGQQLL